VAAEGKGGGLMLFLTIAGLLVAIFAWYESHESRVLEDSKVKREIQTQTVEFVQGVPANHRAMIDIHYKNSGDLPFTVTAAKADLDPLNVVNGTWGNCASNIVRIRIPYQEDPVAQETRQGKENDISVSFTVPDNCIGVKGKVMVNISYKIDDGHSKFERAGQGVMDMLQPD
jgi:hypothetical protein